MKVRNRTSSHRGSALLMAMAAAAVVSLIVAINLDNLGLSMFQRGSTAKADNSGYEKTKGAALSTVALAESRVRKMLGVNILPKDVYRERLMFILDVMQAGPGDETIIDPMRGIVAHATPTPSIFDAFIDRAWAIGAVTAHYGGLEGLALENAKNLYNLRANKYSWMSIDDFNLLRMGCLQTSLSSGVEKRFVNRWGGVFAEGPRYLDYRVSCQVRRNADGDLVGVLLGFRALTDAPHFASSRTAYAYIASLSYATISTNEPCKIGGDRRKCCAADPTQCFVDPCRENPILCGMAGLRHYLSGVNLQRTPLENGDVTQLPDTLALSEAYKIETQNMDESTTYTLAKPTTIASTAGDLTLVNDYPSQTLSPGATIEASVRLDFPTANVDRVGDFAVTAVAPSSLTFAHTLKQKRTPGSSLVAQNFDVSAASRKIDYLIALDLSPSNGYENRWNKITTAVRDSLITRMAARNIDLQIGFVATEGSTSASTYAYSTPYAMWRPYQELQTSGQPGPLLAYRGDPNDPSDDVPRVLRLPQGSTLAEQTVIRNQISRNLTAFRERVKAWGGASGAETGLLGITLALSDANLGAGGYNSAFLRPNAHLAALIVSDSDEAADPSARKVPDAKENNEWFAYKSDHVTTAPQFRNTLMSESYLFTLQNHVPTGAEIAFWKNSTRWLSASVENLSWEGRIASTVGRLRQLKASSNLGVQLDVIGIPFDLTKYPRSFCTTPGHPAKDIAECEHVPAGNLVVNGVGNLGGMTEGSDLTDPSLPADYRYLVKLNYKGKRLPIQDPAHDAGYRCPLDGNYKSCVKTVCSRSFSGNDGCEISERNQSYVPGWAITYGEAARRLGGGVYDLGGANTDAYFGAMFESIANNLIRLATRKFRLERAPNVSTLNVFLDSAPVTPCANPNLACSSGWWYDAASLTVSIEGSPTGVSLDDGLNHSVRVEYVPN